MSGWQVILLEPAKAIFSQIGQFLVNVLLVVIILIIGWVISRVIKTFIIKLLQAIKIDELATRVELDSLLSKGGITYSLSELIGIICYWLAILVTFVVAINAIGLTIAASLLNNVVLYIPNIIAAIFILVLGMFIATLLRNIVQTAAANAGLAQSKLVAKIVEVVTVVFAVIIALEQLKIGAKIIELTISILLASLGLAFGLAFGLGCKEVAGKYVAELIEKIRSKK